jgi:hypothetical protein
MKNKHHLLIQWPLRLLRGVTMLVLTCFATNQVAPAILMVQAAEKQKALFAAPKKTDLDLFGDKLLQVEEALDRMARRLNGEHEFEWQAIAHRGGHGPAASAAQRAELRALEDELEADLPRLEGMQGQVRAYFAQVGQHLRDKNTPADVIARHDEQVAQYESSLRALKDHLHAIKHAKNEAEFKAAVVAADTFMKAHSNKAPRTAFDPTAELAFGPRKSKNLKPAETSAALVKALGLQASQDASAAQAKNAVGAKAFEAELAATKDAPLSAPIRAKAAELNNNPREIYEFVRNNVQFTPTYGSIQGAEFTLDALRGNAFDQASLLIALLRAANIPARYVYGTLEAPLGQVQNWVGGSENANATLDVLGQGGIPAIAVTEGGVVRRVKWEHVWVEAHLDYLPSRGEKHRTGDTWIPMDPSFKQYTYTEGMDLATNVAFDAQALAAAAQDGATINQAEGWAQGFNQTAVEEAVLDYRTRLESYVQSQSPDATVADVLGTQRIIARTLPYLPSTLEKKVVATAQRWTELPDQLRWKFGYEADGAFLVSRSLPELAGKRLALSFKPASANDAQTLASYYSGTSLPASMPAGIVNLVGEFTIDETVVAHTGSYKLGHTANVTQRLFEPRYGWRETQNTLTAGDYQAVGLDVSGVSSRQVAELRTKVEAVNAKLLARDTSGLGKHDLTGNLLQVGISSYFAQTAVKGQFMARSSRIILNRLPSVGTLSTHSHVTYWFGLPRRFVPAGVMFDIDRNAIMSTHKAADHAQWFAFNKGFNQVLSGHEHGVLEELFHTEDRPVYGVSTVKALGVAASQGQRMYSIGAENLTVALSQMSLPSDVEADIANAVNAGLRVSAHQSDIHFAGTTTAGYALEDPTTGAGAMMISSGQNGGFMDWIQQNPGWTAIIGVALGLIAALASSPLVVGIAVVLGLILAVASLISALDTLYDALAAAGCPPWVYGALKMLIVGIALLSLLGGGAGAVIAMAVLGFLVDNLITTITGFLNSSGLCRPRPVP